MIPTLDFYSVLLAEQAINLHILVGLGGFPKDHAYYGFTQLLELNAENKLARNNKKQVSFSKLVHAPVLAFFCSLGLF